VTNAKLTSIEKRGLAFAFLGVFLFSLSLPMTKWALESFDPYFTSTGRAVIAAALAAVILKVRKAPKFKREHLRSFIYTALGAAFGWPILIALALDRPHSTSAKIAVIAAIMPLMTALLAVLRTHERVSRSFWLASAAGSGILVLFALSRTDGTPRDLIADGLTVIAVVASSWCYVEGAGLTKEYPGWQVISWVVIISLPLNLPISIWLWSRTHSSHTYTWHGIVGLLIIGFSSMYLGFFAWYKGLNEAGTARGGQVQQLQALMTLGWSALLLHEQVTLVTLLSAVGVVLCVVWALTARKPLPRNEQTQRK